MMFSGPREEYASAKQDLADAEETARRDEELNARRIRDAREAMEDAEYMRDKDFRMNTRFIADARARVDGLYSRLKDVIGEDR